MRLRDLPMVDDKVEAIIGHVVRTSDDFFPLWEGKGNGMVALVTFRGRPYLTTRLTPDWVVLVEAQIDECLEEQ